MTKTTYRRKCLFECMSLCCQSESMGEGATNRGKKQRGLTRILNLIHSNTVCSGCSPGGQTLRLSTFPHLRSEISNMNDTPGSMKSMPFQIQVSLMLSCCHTYAFTYKWVGTYTHAGTDTYTWVWNHIYLAHKHICTLSVSEHHLPGRSLPFAAWL